MSVTVVRGDSRARLADLADCSVDACVCDPPYELGFMGAGWDSTGVAYDVDLWREVWRVLKPGGHLPAFGGTRTYHRMACAIEDAGFEIRDQLAWAYGSGFPKSLNISKAIDKASGATREVIAPGSRSAARPAVEGQSGGKAYRLNGDASTTAPATDDAREWDGWGTALKPSWEPICLARKPLSERTVAANVLKWGTGALNIDGCRIDGEKAQRGQRETALGRMNDDDWKPGLTIAADTLGRWPANLCHDGSDEVVAGFPSETGISSSGSRRGESGNPFAVVNTKGDCGKGDSGSAARFFYCAKASKLDRLGSDHPTVKPVELMRWLVRLVTPPGGLVLDPFAGSGSTGLAAWVERFDAVLIELRDEAADDIERRLAYVQGLGRTKAMELAHNHDEGKRAKARGDDLPLFGP